VSLRDKTTGFLPHVVAAGNFFIRTASAQMHIFSVILEDFYNHFISKQF